MIPPATRPGRWLAAFLLFSQCSLCLCGESRAELDPQADKPYHLRVVLGIGEHRLLTPVFQERVERELGESLQAALGDLAVVEVTRKHPRLKEVLRDGLQQGLDAWKDVDGVKTHFVLINYVNGAYEIQTRQHDGLTGQASAIVRGSVLPDSDRELVARTAAIMVGKDFGVVGTVTGDLDPREETVRVTLKGSGLGVPLGDWVKPDEVFLLVQITAGAGGERAARVPWAVLRVQRGPDNGVCVCQLFHRHKDPLQKGRGILGYRCLKLSTTRAPLRLRLVQARAGTPVANQHVDIRRQGFTGEGLTKVQGATDPDGFFSTEKDPDHGQFDNLAFVSVVSGMTPLANVPVPVVDDRPVVIPMNLATDSAMQVAFRKDLWVTQVYQSWRALADLFKDIPVLLKARKRDEALSQAKKALAGLQEDLAQFDQQYNELARDAQGQGTRIDLSGGKAAIEQLKSGKKHLEDLIAKLEKVVGEENDPKRQELQAKLSQAQVLEDQAEFGKALALYAEVLESNQGDAELRKKYETLKAAWAVKGAKHKQARDFIYDVWPTLDPLTLVKPLAEAQKALKTCEEVGDMLAPQKMLLVASEHAAKLQERVNALRPDESDDDKATAKIAVEVADGLNRLIKDVKAYLDRAAPAEK
jgi:tetratricopeptide (TPR) repeat protein